MNAQLIPAVLSLAHGAFTVSFMIAGLTVAAFACYLLSLSIAAMFYRRELGTEFRPTSRLLVLVPAHDEAAVIERCIRSLRSQNYPPELYEIVVVADNCSDDTAAIAQTAGADLVLTRNEPDQRGKGYALRWAMDRLLAADPVAAVVVVDADSIADSNFLRGLAEPFEAGARVVQGEYRLYGEGSSRGALRAAAVLLVNRVRPAGRAALGLSAIQLTGNGMLLARCVLLAMPWEAYTSTEDIEYSLELRASGVKIVFAGGAVVLSPAAPNRQAAAQQQLRWEGGKAYLARRRIPQLVSQAIRDRRPALLGLAFDLAVPPLGFLAAMAVAGTAVGACLAADGLVSAWALSSWLVAGTAIPLLVLIGMRAGRASRAEYSALVRAPLLVLATPFRIRRILRFRADTWVRTERAPTPGGRR